MNKLVILISICLITLSYSLDAQSISEIQSWAQQQAGEISSDNVADFVESYCLNPEITFGYQYMFDSISTSMGLIETLTDSTFVIVYASFPNYTSYAIVGTISDAVISYGPEIMFNNGVSSMCGLDSNTVLFTTRSNNGSTVIVGNITGNSIAFGNEVVYSNGNTEYSYLSALDSENFILSYSIDYTYFDNEIFVKKGKLLGSTIQLSDSISVDEGHVTSLGSVALDSSTFVVYYECDGGEARPGKIVGDSIELGPVSAFNNGWNPWYMTATAFGDTTFVLGYGYWAFCGLGIVGTVNDNSITFGTPVVFDSTRVEGIYAATMNNNQFVFSYCDREGGLETTSTTILGTISGYNITFGDEYTSSLYTSTQRAPIATLDSNHFVIGLIDFTQSWSGGAKIGTIGSCQIQTIICNEIYCGGVSPVPILVNSINQITHFSLFMEYDTSHLSYLSYQNLNSQLIDDSLSITDNNGIINIQYNSNIPINISSDTLVDILFDMDISQSGDTNHLIWNDTLSLYINNFGDTIASHFTNGTLRSFEAIGNIGQITGNDSVCTGTIGETYMISSINNSLSYAWVIAPDSAGQIQANDTIAIVSFLPGFAGDASLSVFGTNICGNSDTSYLNISVITTPTVFAGSDTSICENSSCQLSGAAYNSDHTNWITLGDGSFDDPFNTNSIYTPGIQDIAMGEVNLVLFAYGIYPCLGVVNDTVKLSITKLPEVDAGSDDSTCFNNPYMLNGIAYNFSTIHWMTSGDGTFGNPTQLNTYYYAGPDDVENKEVYLVLTASSNYPCEVSRSDTVELTIVDLPIVANTPQGPTVILLDTSYTTDYYTDTVGNADFYIWYLIPPDAGIITGFDNVASVNWNNTFSGILAYIYVETTNYCGSESSDSLVVNISPVGIDNEKSNLDISIFPNPSKGLYNITIKGFKGISRLYISNTQGEIIKNVNLDINKTLHQFQLDLSGQPSGMYFLGIIYENQTHFEQRIILKSE